MRVRLSRILLIISCISGLFFTVENSLWAGEPKPIKALLIAGGCCHDYAKQQELLSKGIMAKANVQVDVYWTDNKTTEPSFPLYKNPNWAEGYDVIIHDECGGAVKDKELIANILNAHKKIPAVNLHCAMHSFHVGEDNWSTYLGMRSNSHGPQKPIAVSFTDREHPITKGLEDWVTVNEELYNNVKELNCKPLARGKQTYDRKGTQVTDDYIVVWTNETQGVRVFSTSLGHNNETVGDDRYLTLVTRGLLWSCDKLKPEYFKPYKGENKVTFYESPNVPLKPLPEPEKIPQKKTTSLKQPAGCKVTASTVENGHPPHEAIDEDPKTRWCAEDGSYPQWVQFELDQAKTARSVKINWEGNHAYQFTLSGSNDVKTWTVLVDASQNKAGGSPVLGIEKPASYKFYRVTGLSNDIGKSSWCSIREVSLQGDGFDGLIAQGVVVDAYKADPYKNEGNLPASPMNLTAAQEAEIMADVKVSEGLKATLFAAPPMANYPVYVAAAPNGDLYVSSDGNGSIGRNPKRGRILRLRDTDNDGKADQVTEFVKDVDSPRGLVWDQDRLYLLHPPHISVYHDKDGDGIAEKEETLINGIAFGFKDRPADHTTNGLTMGIDGWLYIAGGDFGFMDAVGTDGKHLQHRGGGVIRFRPDGSKLELYSTGTRNILETPISPLMDLFARDNTNDGGGWNVRFHHFTGLDDHGYPRMYMNFSNEIIKPLNDYGGGSGCGAVYLSEPGFPDEFNHAPLTCDWGSGALWKHSLTPDSATFKETKLPVPLVRMTRPTDVDVDGLSHIYQASWKGATFNWEGPNVGYIIRVKPVGYTPEPLPDFKNLKDEELVEILKSKSHVRRLTAQRTLLRRKFTDTTCDLVCKLAEDKTASVESRVAALYLLVQLEAQVKDLEKFASKIENISQDPSMMRHVLRSLSDLSEKVRKQESIAQLNAAGLKHEEPRVRLEAIITAGRSGDDLLATQLSHSLDHQDPVIRHTAVRSMVMLKAYIHCFAILDDTTANLELKKQALLVLMRIHDPEVVNGLIERFKSTTDSQLKTAVMEALARLHYKEAPWDGKSWGTRPDSRGSLLQPCTMGTVTCYIRCP